MNKKPLNLRLLDYLAIGSLLWLGLLIYDAQAAPEDALYLGEGNIDGNYCHREQPIWLSRKLNKSTGKLENTGRVYIRGMAVKMGVPEDWEPDAENPFTTQEWQSRGREPAGLRGYVRDVYGNKVEHIIPGKKCMQVSYVYRQPFGVVTAPEIPMYEWRHGGKPCHIQIQGPTSGIETIGSDRIIRTAKTCQLWEQEFLALEEGTTYWKVPGAEWQCVEYKVE